MCSSTFETLRTSRYLGPPINLEEWSVLSKGALSYYIRAHLEFLLDQLGCEDPDELFVHSLVGQLYQVAYMYKGSPFNQVETDFLKKVAEVVMKDARDTSRYGNYGAFIEATVGQFFAALG